VWDLRVAMAWLRGEGISGPIGFMGISLGGYTSALMASLHPELAFVIPIVAPASFADIIWDHGKGHPQRQAAEALGIDRETMRTLWAIHCPLNHTLQVPRERALIVWGQGDRVVPTVHQRALHEHWGGPEAVSFHGGHILHFGRRRFMNAIHSWLKKTAI